MSVKQTSRTLLERYRQQYPLLWNIVLIVIALLIMAVAAHLVMQIGTRHGARRRVPDFTGLRLDEAERVAHKNQLRLSVNDSLFVPAYESGVVLDQLPERGVEVKPDRTIYLTINSFREKTVPVPYVAGRSLRQAKNMLEIAGLEIAELIYRPDIATNYVLEEFCGGKQVSENSKIEAGIGSGITLYVGAEPENDTAVVPMLVGFSLKQAKSRLWELGLNVGRIGFDEGIDLLNQREAGVYIQSPAAEQTAALGTRVDLRLTLDRKKVEEHFKAAEKAAKALAAERLQAEQERADSIAAAALREAVDAATEPATDEFRGDNEGFFD